MFAQQHSRVFVKVYKTFKHILLTEILVTGVEFVTLREKSHCHNVG